MPIETVANGADINWTEPGLLVSALQTPGVYVLYFWAQNDLFHVKVFLDIEYEAEVAEHTWEEDAALGQTTAIGPIVIPPDHAQAAIEVTPDSGGSFISYSLLRIF